MKILIFFVRNNNVVLMNKNSLLKNTIKLITNKFKSSNLCYLKKELSNTFLETDMIAKYYENYM